MQFSERFIIDCRHVPLWRGGTGRALVCALRARAALILLFWSCTGGHCRRRRGRGASLFFKVCDNYCDISHCDCQLLCSTSVHIFQSGSKIKEKTFINRIKINDKGRVCYKKQRSTNSVTFLPLACTDRNNREENLGSSKRCSAEDKGLTSCSLQQHSLRGLQQHVGSRGEDPSCRARQKVLCCRRLSLIQLNQKGGHYKRVEQTGARET